MERDGYEWLKIFDNKWLKKQFLVRKLILYYFLPNCLEKFRHGIIYRLLGVHMFGRFLPTGGIEIRRITGKKMKAYTLKSVSIISANEFLYKSCFFETLHMPFFLALLWRALWWYIEKGNIHLALELFLVNLIFNIYPIMHQRYTRLRIRKINLNNQRR